MNALVRSSAIIALTASLLTASHAAAQSDTVIFVDIANGSTTPPNRGQNGWSSDAHKFLQDALADADWLIQFDQNITSVDIWVAAGTYLPTQGVQDASCFDGQAYCERCCSFRMRNNVEIYGGFPPDPANYHDPDDPATFADRNPVAYETILSGDIGDQPGDEDEFCHSHDPDCTDIYDPNAPLILVFGNYDDNSYHVVRAGTAAGIEGVNRSAILDGFIVEGGIELRGAQPLFRDCVIALHESAAVRCVGGSRVVFHRCTFLGMDCDAIVVDEGSRVAMLACKPAAALAEAETTGKASVGACSILLVVDEAAMMR